MIENNGQLENYKYHYERMRDFWLWYETEYGQTEEELMTEFEQWEAKQQMNPEQTKDRGSCLKCGEGYDNEPEWLYNTECEFCGHPIPEHLIQKKDV